MKTIKKTAEDYADQPGMSNERMFRSTTIKDFTTGVQFAESWIPVTEELPEPEEKVIIQVEFGVNKNIWEIMACHIPAMLIKTEDFMDDEFLEEGDYDAETDAYYVKEGWYEQSLYADINYHISDKVVSWRPINRK